MVARLKALVSWSSGKDSAWMLHVLRQRNEVEVVGLLTTVNHTHRRVAMHAVREELLDAQAVSVGLPLWRIPIPHPCPNSVYEAGLVRAIAQAKAAGITCIAFGDLFLEDIRLYREQQLVGSGIQPLFPIWGMPTDQLAREMVSAGLRAHVTCVDPRQLDRCFAGRTFDESFLNDLPPSVDPCGERGEFHTFAYAGPTFREPIAVTGGPIVERDGFVFADLLPVDLVS